MKLIKDVVLVDINKVTPYSKNPRKHPKKQIKMIAESIKKFGFTVPIVVDHNFEIIAGHGRFAAAELLELDQIPAVVREDLSDEQIKALRVVDNKLSAESEWDYQNLGTELKDLQDFKSIDIEELGFSRAEVDQIFKEVKNMQEGNFLDDIIEEQSTEDKSQKSLQNDKEGSRVTSNEDYQDEDRDEKPFHMHYTLPREKRLYVLRAVAAKKEEIDINDSNEALFEICKEYLEEVNI